MFSGIFDFDRDGTTDAFELAHGFSILEETENDSEWVSPDTDDDEDSFDEDEALFEEEEDREANRDRLERELSGLRSELNELECFLLTVESSSPDDCLSDSYDRWETRRDLT